MKSPADDQVEQGTELGPGMDVEFAAGGDDGMVAGELRRDGEPSAAVVGRRHCDLGSAPGMHPGRSGWRSGPE